MSNRLSIVSFSIALLFSIEGHCLDCISFVGNGFLNHTQSYPAFEKDIQKTQSRLKKSCSKYTTLMSGGHDDSYVLDPNDRYSLKKVTIPIDNAATLVNLQSTISRSSESEVFIHMGDHGAPNGTQSYTTPIQPEDLADIFHQNSSKKFRVSFEHCYSEVMLKSLWNYEEGKVYGCGIATSLKDMPSLSDFNQGLSKNKVSKISSKDFFKDSKELQDSNTLILTSEAFLKEYSEQNITPSVTSSFDKKDSICSPCTSPPSPSSTQQVFKDANFKLLMTEQEALKNIIQSLNQSKHHNTVDETDATIVVDVFENYTNKLLNEKIKRENHLLLVNLNNEFRIQNNCIRSSKKNCKSGSFIKLNNEYLQMKKSIMQTQVKDLNIDIPPISLEPFLKNKTVTLESIRKVLYDRLDKAFQDRAKKRNIKSLEKQIGGLNKIIENRDEKALKIYLDLKNCESEKDI